VAAPAFYEWGGQGGERRVRGPHLFHFILQPPAPLFSLHSGYHPIHSSWVTIGFYLSTWWVQHAPSEK